MGVADWMGCVKNVGIHYENIAFLQNIFLCIYVLCKSSVKNIIYLAVVMHMVRRDFFGKYAVYKGRHTFRQKLVGTDDD